MQIAPAPHPPTTRFQGSKHKLLGWLWSHLAPLPFETCLDAFSGSACVSHFLKGRGKSVTLNDALLSSTLIGAALVENNSVKLDQADIEPILHPHRGVRYDDLISRTFEDIYFTSEENRWLDLTVQNIARIECRFKRAIAQYALFQSAMAKRPYNLFHRRNLYMRLSRVQRSFGNKVTWDRPFERHFRQFISAANDAVFVGPPCKAIHGDAIAVPGQFDLVYIDPPYVNGGGVGIDYHGFYHFLEGLADYKDWETRIDFTSKHRRLFPVASKWLNRATISTAFSELFQRFERSILAVSYRSDGIPSPDEIAARLRRVKPNVAIHTLDRKYKYALSTNAGSSEVLLIGT